MVLAIIQARMGSSRLPGKVLMDLNGDTVLGLLVRRIRISERVNRIVVATTEKPEDDVIERFARNTGVDLFRGSEDDLLDRFYRAAIMYKAQTIVRITADCPLIDPFIVDKVIELFDGEYDYVNNTMEPTFPDGLDVEVFTFACLRDAWENAELPSEREHVTPYIKKHPEKYSLGVYKNGIDYSDLRWTIDEESDYILVKEIMKRIGNKTDFVFQDILDLFAEDPGLGEINQGIKRNEGYLESLKQDLKVKFRKSDELWKRAEKVIPCGTQTISKGPGQFVDGVYPKYISHGKGCHVFDVDGNEYIDYPGSLGAMLLGHGYPVVVEAAQKHIAEGTTFTLMHPLEVELAELLTEVVPCAEMVRFCKNGTDADSGAVRLARACTGREKIAFCGYHGWQDWYVISTDKNAGVPGVLRDYVFRFDYNDIDSLRKIFEQHGNEIAAVIMEPIGINDIQPGFLEEIREITNYNGSLLIFDEIITGFRFALGGAQEITGVVPDIACIGKAMGNGMPISAIVGKREYMKEFERVFFSGTFYGETSSIAAALATIREVKERNVIGHIWRQGKKLKDGFNAMAGDFRINAECVGYPPRTKFYFYDKNGKESLQIKSLFMQETIKRGILFGAAQLVTYSHTVDDINKTLEASREALKVVKKACEMDDIDRFMEGNCVGIVFRPV